MTIAVHLPVSVAVAADMALTGFVGTQIVSPWAPCWQAPAYHADQDRAVAGATHSDGYRAGEPANYPGDGSDDHGTADNSGGGGAGG
jgi:hypothetical protein